MRLFSRNSMRAVAVGSGLAVAIGAVIVGCKSGGASAMLSSIPSLPSFGSHPSGDSSSTDSNTVGDAVSHFAPGNTGGYVTAGMTALSGLRLGREDEDQMGQAVAIAVTNTYPLDNNAVLNRYVAMVGYVVAEASPRPDGNFVFGVLATDTVGAYSGPNGYVMITRGAIRKMSNEAELAGVLGHEIAHVCNEDGLNAVRHGRLSDAGAKAGKTALSANANSSLFDSAVDSGTDVILKRGYDRAQEMAADTDSVTYVAAAGYDPASYLQFIDRMAAEQGPGGGVSVLFSTHPGLADRSRVVAAAVAASGKAGTGATNAARFQLYTK